MRRVQQINGFILSTLRRADRDPIWPVEDMLILLQLSFNAPTLLGKSVEQCLSLAVSIRYIVALRHKRFVLLV